MSTKGFDFHQAEVSSRWTRREALTRMAGGFGALGLAGTLQAAPHFPAKAKRIIYIVLNGGMSQVDTFDPKPMLTKYDGKPMPGGAPKTERATGTLMGSPFAFQRKSSCGTEVSEIFPRLGTLMDECCVIRSMHTDVPNHEPSLFMINCGAIQPGRPSLGSWLMYGLGTENQNLPGFVVLCPGVPVVGPPLWSSAFLPAVFQGTFLKNNKTDPFELIRDIKPQAEPKAQRRQLDLLKRLNEEHLAKRAGDSQLEASISAMETAFRMQTEAPDAFDVRKESEATRARYGDSDFGRSCLMARRLVERGVRMVQIYFGNSQPWDSHEDIQSHKRLAATTDPGVASLLEDLKQRGLLQDTLVVLGTEFGRTPAVETGSITKVHNGRDHNSLGFSVVLAGGGVKGGITYGATDEFGYRAVEKRCYNHDLNATILHLMGIDHTALTYSYSGRNFRLTDVAGEVVREVIA
ncbi:DUF1501 domain-containing protein [Bryobacter aggregatus]|uniref:DUF1501 domain-containing protein n=1 Tax=Bryobacter aggregatus TaxID=360054 RepID=UPI00068D197B|nr:DUF1501 domain-containing protein [Bryobacter aggregatus]